MTIITCAKLSVLETSLLWFGLPIILPTDVFSAESLYLLCNFLLFAMIDPNEKSVRQLNSSHTPRSSIFFAIDCHNSTNRQQQKRHQKSYKSGWKWGSSVHLRTLWSSLVIYTVLSIHCSLPSFRHLSCWGSKKFLLAKNYLRAKPVNHSSHWTWCRL